jgi:hypothetical protein
MIIDGQDRPGVDSVVRDHPETGKGGQWPEWLSAKEAEVYSLQVHQYKIKEKTWRRQTHKEPSPVKWQDENTPTGTRYVFYRPDVDSYVVDRRKEADDAIARSRMVKDRHDRTEMDMTGRDRSEEVRTGPDHVADEEKNKKIDDFEKQVLNLQIDNRAKEQVIGHLTDERKEFIAQLGEQGRVIGTLETQLRQLQAPRQTDTHEDTDRPSGEPNEKPNQERHTERTE